MDTQAYKDLRVSNLENQIKLLECSHPKKETRSRHASNGSKMYKLQCTRCGELFGNWIPHNEIPDTIEISPIDDELKQRYSETCFELGQALNDRKKEVDKIDFNEWYKSYLQSPEWADRRRRVIGRCKNICEGCGIKTVAEIHHTTYSNVGSEFLFELLGLCSECHNRIHTKESETYGQDA